MGRSTPLALARIVTLAASVVAPGLVHAADLLPPPPPPLPPPPVDFAGGWYLRGDVGASIYNTPKVSTVPDPDPVHYYNSDLGGGGFAGAGVGYQFNSWFRADVTGEYRFSSGFHTNDRVSSKADYYNADGLRTVAATQLDESTNGNYSAGVVLVNGYVEKELWGGLGVFAGAGVGAAFNRFSGLSEVSINATKVSYPDNADHPGQTFGGTSGGTYKNRIRTNFAWALHAGLSYAVTPNLKLELAYRYLNLGEGATGVLNCFCGQTYQPFKVKDIEAHDVKLGMRWMFGAPVLASYEPPPPPMAPLVRKY
ncbi:outer membrane protein [Methylobacterium nonmethylotrophicum]|uniref:Porin family protein n=1 Tax=Methylobacterium nonmethylotrophicum TaxID=1141884 RepID=A0A4Z0NGZ2_9HYPH|nr:outer membrane beta-barrel protein [Methylobacterium nonmethylotrophicum]TGD95593.1 porin family protein [Methylobacterium nonmethylotrophicum]